MLRDRREPRNGVEWIEGRRAWDLVTGAAGYGYGYGEG